MTGRGADEPPDARQRRGARRRLPADRLQRAQRPRRRPRRHLRHASARPSTSSGYRPVGRRPPAEDPPLAHLRHAARARCATASTALVLDQFLHHLVEAAQRIGYRVQLFTARDDDDELATFADLLATSDLDGFLLTGTHHGDPRTAWLAVRDVPFVTFGRPWGAVARHSWVDVDGAAGTRAAVAPPRRARPPADRLHRLAARLRHRRGPPRRAGERGMADAGLPVPRSWELAVATASTDGRAAAARARRAARRRRPRSCARATRWPSAPPSSGLRRRRLRRHPRRRRARAHHRQPAARRGRRPRACDCSSTASRAATPSAPDHLLLDPHLTVRSSTPSTTQEENPVRMSDRRPRRAALAAGAALALLTAACGGSGFDEDDEQRRRRQEPGGPASLQILIGSSGPAETDAVTAAAEAWAEESGNDVEVIAATDLNQQLSQGFAANEPPDVFYLSSDTFAEYAANGSLLPYAGDLENADDFYPNLREAFTYEDEFYCAPKDFSTLGLVINTDVVGGRRPDRRRRPDHLGRAARGREDADHRRPGRPGHQPRVPAAGRLHGRGRRRPGHRRRGHRGLRGQRRGAGLRQVDARGRTPGRPPVTSAPAGAARRSAPARRP